MAREDEAAEALYDFKYPDSARRVAVLLENCRREVLVVIAALLPPPPPVTDENFDPLKEGIERGL